MQPQNFEYENPVSPETDNKLIDREFVEKPDHEVTILASNLQRADGFAKSLICGSITTSEELVDKIGKTFVRTHRGYYKSFPPSLGIFTNKNLSFRVGLGQRMYSQEKHIGSDIEWKKGLGIVLPAEKLLESSNSKITWGHLHLDQIIAKNLYKVSKTTIEQKISQMSENDLEKYDNQPPKEDLIDLINLARRNQTMNESRDQAEANLEPVNEVLPRLDLKETIILIPAQSKAAFLRLMEIKLKECMLYSQQIQETFGVDITFLTPEKIISQYANIYWYPQDNIGQAIKYLTTHPEKVISLSNNI